MPLPDSLSDYSYCEIPFKHIFVPTITYDNGRMIDPAHAVALCCYKSRAVALNRCKFCKPEYACPAFESKAALLQFNAIIPPSMLLAPLPIELWPNMCGGVPRDMSQQPAQPTSNESTESPLRRFASTLGLSLDADRHST
jgi:hypothetical protein